MRFRELAERYEELERTTKRLEMRATIARAVREAPRADLAKLLYLSQGLLRPEYEGVELGVADSLARRAIAIAAGVSPEEVGRRAQASGDLGRTAEELLRDRPKPLDPGELSIDEVYDGFLGIARTHGPGSTDAKVDRLASLLARATPLEARYLIRFALGTLRVGVREMTILDALSEAFGAGDPAAREQIEDAFNLTSDIGLVAEVLAERGLSGLRELRLTVGRPVRPMLAERARSLEEILTRMGGRAAFEFKYDGLRVQAHLAADGSVRLFSRRLEEIGPQFPELAPALVASVRQRPSIIEGECIPVDPETGEMRPFQEVSRRRGRKHEVTRLAEEVPVVLVVFDVLLAGGESLLAEPMPKRRAALESLVRPAERVQLAVHRPVASPEEAAAFFDEAVAAGAEGIMAKSLAPESVYRPGARGFWWIKYKREYVANLDDSIDGVVVGGFYGRGRRAGRFGSYLLAAYNPTADRFESFTRVGSGFDDRMLERLAERLRPWEVDERPPGVDTGLAPDRWIRPQLVLEVKGAELTLSPVHRAAEGRFRPGAGLALRFPRFTGRLRDDKGPTDATTSDELAEMYARQARTLSKSTAAPPPPDEGPEAPSSASERGPRAPKGV